MQYAAGPDSWDQRINDLPLTLSGSPESIEQARALNSVFLRDYPVVIVGTVMAAVIVCTVNLPVDILYGILDPRIRIG